MADLITASYVESPQELPEWLSYSTYVTTIDNIVLTTQAVIQLPQTYYGPSIPLGEDWTYDGLTSPASNEPVSASTTAVEPASTAEQTSTTASSETTETGAVPASGTLGTAFSSSSAPSATTTSIPSSPTVSSTALPLSSAATSTDKSTSATPPLPPPASSETSNPSGLSTASLILAVILPILAFFLLLIGFLLWRRRLTSRGKYGAVERRSPAVDGNAVSAAGAGAGGLGLGQDGSDGGGAGVPGVAGEYEGDRRWLPTLLITAGLRKRTSSARMHNNRVPSTNVWGDGSDDGEDEDGFEMVQLPGAQSRSRDRPLGGAGSDTVTYANVNGEEEEDGQRTPRARQSDEGVVLGRRGMDDTREELGTLLGESTPTGKKGGGKGKLMAVLGIGAAAAANKKGKTEPEQEERMAQETGTGRRQKISQTDSSTPSSRGQFFPVPVGTASTSDFRGGPAAGGKGHTKSDSFPSMVGGDRDLFYAYPIPGPMPSRQETRRAESAVVLGPILPIAGEPGSRSGSGSRFSILDAEEYSSGSASSRPTRLGRRPEGEQDLVDLGLPAALGLGIGLGMGAIGSGDDGSRTPNSYRSANSQLRFPVPPTRSQESLQDVSGGMEVLGNVSRSVSADTSGTRYHSLTDQPNTLTRRSRSTATVTDETAGGIDEYGRRTVSSSDETNASHGISSALPINSLGEPRSRTIRLVEDPEATPMPSSSRSGHAVPLSALPSPISAESPSYTSPANRFSLIAGSISSLFGAKRASVVSNSTEDDVSSPLTSRRPTSVGMGPRTSYAGQPLVGEEVYRDAFLSGIPENIRRDRQESSGETRETNWSGSGRRDPSEGVLSEEDGSGETFGVKAGRGDRARVVTSMNRGGDGMRTGSTGEDVRVGEFGEVLPVDSQREVLRLPEDMRKTSALFVRGSPYSPAQASSQEASIQGDSSKSSHATSSVSKSSASVAGSMNSGESLGVVSGQYSVAAVRGKRSMPQLVRTPDALAGIIPRTDTPPPASSSSTQPGPFSMTPLPVPALTPVSQPAEEALLPPRFSAGRSESPSSSEKKREKEKWWLGRFGKEAR